MRYLAKGREIEFKAGDVIYRVGDLVGENAIFYVSSGKVRLHREFEDKTRFVYELGAEDTFGIVSTMAEKVREQTSTAIEDVKLYCWDRDAFESAVSLYIEFARISIQHQSRYLRAVNRALTV